MSRRSRVSTVRCSPRASLGFLLVTIMIAAGNARAVEFGDLFRTPEQRAAARFDSGDYDALIENAPDARWEGLARYRKGDHAGAADAFARARALQEENADDLSPAERNERLFDQATAATQAGRPGDALPLFDEIITSDPQHADALHNREIARRLQALDAAQNQQQNGDQGEDDGDQQGDPSSEGDDAASDPNSGDGQEMSSDEESGKPGEQGSGESESDESSARSSDSAGSEHSDDERGDEASDDPSGIDADEQQAAREALAAEAANQGEDGDDGEETLAGAGVDEIPTPSEGQQATEQWLRRIADDPTGLLRRRLEQSHRNDYPEVRNSDEPW